MFSRSVNRQTARISITARLVILFTIAAGIIFTGTSFLLYSGLVHSLEERSLHYLRDEVNLLKVLLVGPNSLEEVRQEISHESGTLEYVQHYVRVLDQDGTVLVETKAMDRLIPVSAFPVPDQDQGPYGERGNWITDDGQLFMLKALRTVRGDTAKPVILQVALNSTRRKVLIDSFRNRIIFVTGGGVLASLLASALVARSGLRPLRKITLHTQEVSASHLDERLKPGDWPKELNELAISFNLMLKRLQDSFDCLSHFASNMAHEFRTPLSNLMVEGGVTLAKPRCAKEYRELIESNMEEYRRLSQIVDSLLFLARAENRTQPLNTACFDLAAELKDLVDYYHPMAEEKGINLKVGDLGDTVLSADINLVRRAVANLLVNAVRNTPEHGTIAVSCRQVANGSTTVAVTDTGCGISSEEIPRLFDRFYRVESVRNNHPKGHGLGLSIVKSIMDLHGGTIDIQSQPGEGTTVTLSFPP